MQVASPQRRGSHPGCDPLHLARKSSYSDRNSLPCLPHQYRSPAMIGLSRSIPLAVSSSGLEHVGRVKLIWIFFLSEWRTGHLLLVGWLGKGTLKHSVDAKINILGDWGLDLHTILHLDAAGSSMSRYTMSPVAPKKIIVTSN